MLSDCGVKELSPHLISYISWLPRFTELMQRARKTIALLPQLTTPTCSFQSREDELVGKKACKYLDAHPCITNTVLESSGHFCYSQSDTLLLQQRLRAFLSQHFQT